MVKKMMRVDKSIYVVGALLKHFDSNERVYSLYKVLLDDTTPLRDAASGVGKNPLVSHELVASNLEINRENIEFAVDSNVG